MIILVVFWGGNPPFKETPTAHRCSKTSFNKSPKASGMPRLLPSVFLKINWSNAATSPMALRRSPKEPTQNSTTPFRGALDRSSCMKTREGVFAFCIVFYLLVAVCFCLKEWGFGYMSSIALWSLYPWYRWMQIYLKSWRYLVHQSASTHAQITNYIHRHYV